jgi:signal transduction histidine kinase
MGSFVRKKLFYQTLAFILPFAVGAIVLASAILVAANHRFFQKTILADYANIINVASDGISLFAENARMELETLALAAVSLKLDPWQKEIALTAFVHQNPRFSSVDLISPQGGVIASAEPASPSQPPPNRDLLDRALSGQTAVSPVMADENGLTHVDYYVPVMRLGQVEEILRARLSLKFIWEIIEDIHIGETGQVYVMDGSGRVIAHREIHRVLQPSDVMTPEALDAVRGQAGPVQWVEVNDGADYSLAVYMPDTDWIVALTQPRREVFAYFYQNTYWAGLIILCISMAAVFWGWRGSRRLLAPIQALHLHARGISRGDLDQKVSVDREDEIGDLGRAFNDMTDALKEYVDREVESACTLAHGKNLATLGTVASKVSHEMGNFLFGVQMMLSGLKKEPLSPNGRHILNNIEGAMAQTRIFIKQFMNFARKPELHFTRGALDDLIREVVDVLGPEADARKIAVTVDWDPTIPPVRMDAGLMNQVFTNLVRNSIEAMAGSGAITIAGKVSGSHLLISVADTGPGMKTETMKRIYEPFFTSKGVLGNGLGLSIVKSNIEIHDGTIECISAPGQGTEFLIRLPLDFKA